MLGGDEPAYLLSGARLSHPVTYLPAGQAVTQALAHRLSYVVISTGINRPAAGLFRGAGWNVRPLGSYWLLATVPLAGTGNCRT